MDERKFLGRIDCQSTDGEEASLIVYELGNEITIVSSVRNDGDAEIQLNAGQLEALLDMLGRRTENR